MGAELKQILYVEDDADIAQIAIFTLEQLGAFHVVHCSSGQDAIAAYEAHAPQLLLMDVMMPQMDGPETIERLKQIHGSDCAPFIFMTARAQHDEQETYRRLGALAVIVKPFDPMTLCDEIRTIWEGSLAA